MHGYQREALMVAAWGRTLRNVTLRMVFPLLKYSMNAAEFAIIIFLLWSVQCTFHKIIFKSAVCCPTVCKGRIICVAGYVCRNHHLVPHTLRNHHLGPGRVSYTLRNHHFGPGPGTVDSKKSSYWTRAEYRTLLEIIILDQGGSHTINNDCNVIAFLTVQLHS